MSAEHHSDDPAGKRGHPGPAEHRAPPSAHGTNGPPAAARVRLGVPALALGLGLVVGWGLRAPGEPGDRAADRGPIERRPAPTASVGESSPVGSSPSTAARADARASASAGPADGLDARLEAIRRLASARAWERPAGENVRDALAELEKEAGSAPRVKELRQELADRLVADAVALRYAGSLAAAADRVRLALRLAPEQLGARDFLADLERADEQEAKGAGAGDAPLLPKPNHLPSTPPGALPAVPAHPDAYQSR